MPTLFIIAGEPSGDALGAKLANALCAADPSLVFQGIAGERMQAAGIPTLFPMEELSLMGFAEILPHIPRLLRRIKETVEAIEKSQPDLVITIDSPGFTFRVAKSLRERGYKGKLLHYVAPTVWAYKPERAAKIAKLFDHLMVLLPFEPPYFEKEGLTTHFVGHPIIEEIQGSETEGQAFGNEHNIPDDALVLTVMAGSRKGEVKRLLPVIEETMKRLRATFPNLHIVLPTVKSVEQEVREAVARWNMSATVVEGAKARASALSISRAALVKSGTVTLEVALAKVPMVLMYKVHPITAWLLRRMLTISTAGLVNLLVGDKLIPEYIQEDCTPDKLAPHMEKLLRESPERALQTEAMGKALQLLGQGEVLTPSQKAAATVLKVLH
jgi:lipid-A-disaccharide synthase